MGRKKRGGGGPAPAPADNGRAEKASPHQVAPPSEPPAPKPKPAEPKPSAVLSGSGDAPATPTGPAPASVPKPAPVAVIAQKGNGSSSGSPRHSRKGSVEKLDGGGGRAPVAMQRQKSGEGDGRAGRNSRGDRDKADGPAAAPGVSPAGVQRQKSGDFTKGGHAKQNGAGDQAAGGEDPRPGRTRSRQSSSGELRHAPTPGGKDDPSKGAGRAGEAPMGKPPTHSGTVVGIVAGAPARPMSAPTPVVEPAINSKRIGRRSKGRSHSGGSAGSSSPSRYNRRSHRRSIDHGSPNNPPALPNRALSTNRGGHGLSVKDVDVEIRSGAPHPPFRVEARQVVNFLITDHDDHQATLYMNYPAEQGVPFHRKLFYPFAVNKAVDGCRIVTFQFDTPGVYAYYLIRPDADRDSDPPRGKLIVNPRLEIGQEHVPMEALTCQTLLSRNLGKVQTWGPQLMLMAETGYNMIHFTPVQRLGSSGSCYSVSSQNELNREIFDAADEEGRVAQLRGALEAMERDHKMLSMTDVVYNHTAFDSPWLVDHPEAGYNLDNSPHLRPAFDLDRRLLDFSNRLADGKVPGLTGDLRSEDDLSRLIDHFRAREAHALMLWEYYTVDIDACVGEFRGVVEANTPFKLLKNGNQALSWDDTVAVLLDRGIRHGSHDRNSATVDLNTALGLFNVPFNATARPSRDEIESRVGRYRRVLEVYNAMQKEEISSHIEVALNNIRGTVRYERLDPGGKNKGRITRDLPLVEPYFTVLKGSDGKTHALANNGFIWGGDPLVDFAGRDSSAYLRREVVIWGDCVKLRYGDARSDSPFLWDHMTAYTEQMAKLFHAFRVDNAHGTPLHVAATMLDIARRVRPNIYIVAELFTGREELDVQFVSRLGIHGLVRESMRAETPWRLGGMVHQFGGLPVGSFSAFDGESIKPSPVLPAAILYDCTHDNETPAEIRTPADALTNAALVAMSFSAIGSTRGYDELVPHNISVVSDRRAYLAEEKTYSCCGMVRAKAMLNWLHRRMACDGLDEVYVHQTNGVISVHRNNPKTNEGVVLIAFPAFKGVDPMDKPHSIKVPGAVDSVLFEAQLTDLQHPHHFSRDEKFINGLSSTLLLCSDEGSLSAEFVDLVPYPEQKHVEVVLNNLSPGCIVVLSTCLPSGAREATENTICLMSSNLRVSGSISVATLSCVADNQLIECVDELDLLDLNAVLYRSEAEEQDSMGWGAYSVPGFGKLTYCGLQGVEFVMACARRNNDLGSAVADHLREGNWLMDHCVARLHHLSVEMNLSRVEPLHRWFRAQVTNLKGMPRYLIPKMFDVLIRRTVAECKFQCYRLMNSFVQNGSSFVKSLALCSIQMYGVTKDSSLPDVAPADSGYSRVTMAAGLPHFAVGYMRSWGRDTFIALRGLMLCTGRFDEARSLIIGFAGTLRHGLIPNLLASGNCRFNCRDASWWWLNSLQEYCKMAPNGTSILVEPIRRLYNTDDQEIMSKHARGIWFREWNAGRQIDAHMKDEGFNVSVRLDVETGIIYGGSKDNCGTWMDKMGESHLGHNDGVPATPRDGADVEIVALCKATVRWLAEENKSGRYPFSGVELGGGRELSFSDWNSRLQSSFEKFFWVPEDPSHDAKYSIDQSVVHRRGIYKDTHGSHHRYTDYQLRPNLCVAMVVAPEMFDRSHAQQCIKKVRDVLAGPLGMRTLDPKDMQYRGDYDNSHDQEGDFFTSKGFNYHLGPEWLWCTGFYLRAYWRFGPGTEEEKIQFIGKAMEPHRDHLKYSPFEGLPELTNANGAPCGHSCPTQAWSQATLLETLHELNLWMESRAKKRRAKQ